MLSKQADEYKRSAHEAKKLYGKEAASITARLPLVLS